jgi:hypothetical protein
MELTPRGITHSRATRRQHGQALAAEAGRSADLSETEG